MKLLHQIALVVVVAGMIGSDATAQVPVRARSQIRIPVKKNETAAVAPPPRPAPVVGLVPGIKTEVIGPPVVVHLIRTEAGTPVMLVERAPTPRGGFAVPWIPLFGLLGGAILIHSLDHGDSGTPSTPDTPTPPVTPPVVPPVIPPPTTTTPEPASLILVATGLAGLALVRRRRAS